MATPNSDLLEKLKTTGMHAIQAGDYGSAIKYFYEALDSCCNKEGEEAIDLTFYIGFAFKLIGEIDEAIIKLNAVLERNPNHYKALITRVSIYASSLKDYSKAISDSNRAIALEPTNTEGYYFLGFVYAQLDNYAAALRAFDKAIELEPEGYQNYGEKALVYIRLRKPQEALENLNKAILLFPLSGQQYFLRGKIYHEIGKGRQALYDFEMAILLTDESNKKQKAAAFSRYSWIMMEEYNDIKEALVRIKQAVKLDPNEHTYQHQYGALLATDGKIQEALKYYKKAIKLDPSCESCAREIEMLKKIMNRKL